jgi:hypothetical protein
MEWTYREKLLEEYRAHEGHWPGLISSDHGIVSDNVDLEQAIVRYMIRAL